MPQSGKSLLVAGARPNFMKIAPLMEALARRPEAPQPFLVHTGQHYDEALSKIFFEELGIPKPDTNLGVGSGSQARQTAEVMQRFEPVLEEQRPAVLIVVGDVNSTLACSIVAAKCGVPIAHVEAGLRSYDRKMPEEINRVLTDRISDVLLVSEPSGVENLRKEGLEGESVHLVGNVMVDTLLRHLEKARASGIVESLGLNAGGYAVLTLHRPSNVDDRETLTRIVSALRRIGSEIPVVFPAHPRTLARVERMGLRKLLESTPGLRPVKPLGYLDFLRLQADARMVLTDSGGIQEETTVLGVPCLTIRENTERPITLTQGTNVLVGTDPARIEEEALRAMSGRWDKPAGRPDLWDGKAAERIVDILARKYAP